jgi:hypothetical protein
MAMTQNTKIALGVVALVAALTASQYLLGNTDKDIYNRTHPWDANKEAQAAAANREAMNQSPLTLPGPSGSEKAPIQMLVFIKGGDECHTPGVQMVEGAKWRYPGQLRVVYYDTRDPENARKALAQKISCTMGVVLNGSTSFKMPGRGSYGLVDFQGPPTHGKYTMDDLYAAIEMLLKEKGINVTAVTQAPAAGNSEAPALGIGSAAGGGRPSQAAPTGGSPPPGR